jgi:peroxiredoxin
MAVASLTKFTVPLASDQSAQSQGLLMPKLKYRFRVIFENFGVTAERTELTKQVVSVTRPTVTFDEVTLDVYN